MEGWIKVHRKIVNWEWYNDANTFRVFFHLLLTANHEDKRWRGRQIKRGQLITSIANLGKTLRLSPQAIRTSISKLKSTGEITSKSTSQYTIVTLCNYDFYNDLPELSNKRSSKQHNKRATNEQQTSNKRATTTKELKKERIKEGKNIDTDSFVADEFKNVWLKWIDYRKLLKKPYKTSEGVLLSYQKLMNLANNNFEIAEKIIKQSMTEEWQGFFPLKNNGHDVLKQQKYISPARRELMKSMGIESHE